MKKLISRSLKIKRRPILSPVAPLSVLCLQPKVTSNNDKNEVRKTALGFSDVPMDVELDLKEVLMNVLMKRRKTRNIGGWSVILQLMES